MAALVRSRKANLLMMDENQLQTVPTVAAKATLVMSSTDQLTSSVEELLGYCDALELEPNTQNLRHINQAMIKNPDFFIPKPTYDLLKEMMPAEQFKEFLTKKLALEKASRSSLKTTSNTYKGRPNENIPPVAPVGDQLLGRN